MKKAENIIKSITSTKVEKQLDGILNMTAFLKQFHDINESDFKMLSGKFKPKSFKKNDFMVVPGQIQKELYFVKSGVQMSFFESDHKDHVIAFTYNPGLCAIPDSFSFQTPSKYYLSCLTESEFEAITYHDLQLLFDQSQALERLFRKMTEVLLAGMINRHVELQALSMEERYRSFCNRSGHLLHLIPHKYIASYLAIDASNFSKLFNKIKF